MSKWVVCVNQLYYPEVTEYGTYEEAKEAYERDLKFNIGNSSDVYLCEVKEQQTFKEVAE